MLVGATVGMAVGIVVPKERPAVVEASVPKMTPKGIVPTTRGMVSLLPAQNSEQRDVTLGVALCAIS